MLIIHKSILIKNNIIPNPYMWIVQHGYCGVCKNESKFDAYSPIDMNEFRKRDCYEVCRNCNCFETVSSSWSALYLL